MLCRDVSARSFFHLFQVRQVWAGQPDQSSDTCGVDDRAAAVAGHVICAMFQSIEDAGQVYGNGLIPVETASHPGVVE